MTKQRLKTTTVRLDPEIWRRAKYAASRAPMTLGEYLQEALLTKLAQDEVKKDA